MKYKHFMHKALNTSLCFLVTTLFGASIAHADDIDDIESDMEATISESDAAQSEATASKVREREEQKNLERTKTEANNAMATAKVKEAQATKEIKAIETRIAALLKEKKKFEEVKAAAEKRIVVVTEKLNAKKTSLTEIQGQRDAAETEKKTQEEALAKLVDEQKGIENDIKNDREKTASYVKDIADYKKKSTELEAKLVVLRKSAARNAEKLEKTRVEHDEMRRKMGSIPTKVIVRQSKLDCDVVDAAADGAKSVGRLKAGQKYEIYRVIEKKWVLLQFGKTRAYAARTCF